MLIEVFKINTNGDNFIYMTWSKALVMQGGLDVMIDGLYNLNVALRRTE